MPWRVSTWQSLQQTLKPFSYLLEWHRPRISPFFSVRSDHYCPVRECNLWSPHHLSYHLSHKTECSYPKTDLNHGDVQQLSAYYPDLEQLQLFPRPCQQLRHRPHQAHRRFKLQHLQGGQLRPPRLRSHLASALLLLPAPELHLQVSLNRSFSP